jgi:AcrR family transcriptional regulator
VSGKTRRQEIRMDRRIARTRSMLQRALIGLMTRKGYDAITVEEVCQEADIGRSTFYAHFTGKDHLKRSGLDDHLRAMLLEHQRAAAQRPLDGGFGFVLPFLEHARGQLDLYRALVSKGGVATTTAMLRRIVTELVRNELSSRPAPRGLRPEVATAFVVGGFMSLLTWWLDGGARLPPAELDAMFRQLVSQGLGEGRAEEPGPPAGATP